MKRNAYREGLSVLAIVVSVCMLAGLLLFLVAGCSVALAPNHHLPRPPRHLTIEKAQQYNARLYTPKYLNRRYQAARPR